MLMLVLIPVGPFADHHGAPRCQSLPRPGRPRIDNAANVEVNAGVESGDVADDFGLAGAEPVKDLLAFEQRSVAIDVLRCDAGLDETLLKVLRVFPVNAVTKRRPVLAFTRTTF
jgi:hypothetical protein